MPDFFKVAAATTDPVWVIVLRLVVAMVFGAVVALVYRKTRRVPASSFTSTLVLLAILIAMVTQVIGDNVARAFSLVGALSIVRFRTVVRDTQDTAYVIGAVAVGMAVGAGHLSVAVAGIAVVAVAAFAMRQDVPVATAEELPTALTVRLALGKDEAAVVGPVLDTFVTTRRVVGVSTARQGAALEVSYRLALKDPERAQALVAALNAVEGVQGVDLRRTDVTVDP
jgi:uncharacterized membrane protein YhiD involved in acid resistance